MRPTSPTAEASDLKSLKSRFESGVGYQLLKLFLNKMNQDQGMFLRDCIRASAKIIATELGPLQEITSSLGSIVTELKEINSNLYDIDSRLSKIAAQTEKL